ncbi:MAG TPA: serine/threonine-protein kinase, partial [Longimicrobiales bacterium]|nr:serine/threonine-protein kinase [Longimicrobiales bacterium]
EDGRAFIAMTYCEGESLALRLARGPLPLDDAMAIARQLAAALDAAHAIGIVHRDVKPANVIVSAGGRTRLMDFGVASVAGTREGRPGAGTPAYMSPEQRAGALPAPAADIYALGLVLFEMLAGQRPGEPWMGTLSPVSSAPAGESLRALRGDVPAALVRLVERCLDADPAARPSAAECATTLRTASIAKGPRVGRRVRLAAAAILAIAVLALGWFARSPRTGTASASAGLAVLPFVPAAADTALERLGRELVVTVSANLQGIAGLRVVDPIAVLGQPENADAGLEVRMRQAARLGASSVLLGQLSRTGTRVRAAAVVRTDSGIVTQVSVEAAAEDIAALTDSLTLALFRTPWAAGTAPAPSPAAIRTRSVAALRAYLDGELAIAGARFRLAPEAFARAIEADSTFWFAYWRYWFARSYHGSPVDSAIVATVLAHRATFPEPDRLLVEARMANGQRARLERLRVVTERHPSYWPAWFELGDHVTHAGAFLGVPLEEAGTALRRTVELNPRFVPAWEHLLWTSLLQRDTAQTGRVLAELQALRMDTLAPLEWDLRPLDYYRYLDHLARSGGEPRDEDAEIGVRVLTGTPGEVDPERRASTILLYGFPRAQLHLSQRIVAARPAPGVVAAHLWGGALAWAGRGAWDSAFAAARQYARTATHPRGALWAYGLVTAGAWLGRLHPDSSASLRELAARSEAAAHDDGQAELAWLDGLIACTRGRDPALARARAVLESSGAPAAPTLAASLAALADARAGHTADAARALAALEAANADRSWQQRHGAQHPFVIAINRIAAARWLLTAGDTGAAIGLLRLHETDLPNTLQPLPAVNQVLGTFTLPLLADVEAARGRVPLARRHRAAWQERADLAGDGATRSEPCRIPD